MKKNDYLKDLTLLYVEDEETTREHLLFYLEDNFKEVIVAKDGEEALFFFKNKLSYIDLIISDIQMPKMDGLKMLKQMKDSGNLAPCILTTAYDDHEYLYEAIELGVISYLVKPINIDSLFEKIDLAMQSSFKKTHLTTIIQKIKPLNDININELIKALDTVLGDMSRPIIVPLFKNFKYDFANKYIKEGDKIIPLSRQEILIMEYLIKHQNQVTTYEELIHLISLNQPSLDTLRTNIKFLRAKTDKKLIVNLSGIGYKLAMSV